MDGKVQMENREKMAVMAYQILLIWSPVKNLMIALFVHLVHQDYPDLQVLPVIVDQWNALLVLDFQEKKALQVERRCGRAWTRGISEKSGKPGPPGLDRTYERGVRGQKGLSGQYGLCGPPGKNGNDGARGHPAKPGLRGQFGTPGEKGKNGLRGMVKILYN